MQVRNYIGTGILFAGVVTLAGTVLACDIQHLPPGEQAYQLYILSRTASFFAASSLLFSLLVEKNKRASIFYFTTIWALIVTGGIEAIWGLQQVYGIAESNHSRYSLTGSFYNPGPYSGYLAMVFPLCLSECLRLSKLKGKVWWQQVLYYLAMAETLLLLCILPAGMSRSAWIAALAAGTWVCAIHFAWLAKWKEWIKEKKKRIYATAGIGLLALLLASYALFQLKADSASGRWFMWKISCLAIAECPLTGHGSGRFVEAYGQAQENYSTFFKKIDHSDAPLPLPDAIKDDIIGIVNAVNHNVGVNKFLFEGAPGTGKTETAKQIARILNRDLLIVDFDTLIDSKLGQTQKNISALFDEIQKINNHSNVIILFDEIDAIAIDRVNSNDIREMGRATTAMLKGFDNLNDNIVLIATTNLFSVFDKALVRRFDAVINFNRYQKQDLIEIAIIILNNLLSKFKIHEKNTKLFKKIISTMDTVPYPGELKNLLKTSIAFSNPAHKFDYLKRLFNTITKNKQPSLKELQNKGFTVREIEILTGISKSQVGRELKESYYE